MLRICKQLTLGALAVLLLAGCGKEIPAETGESEAATMTPPTAEQRHYRSYHSNRKTLSEMWAEILGG